MKRRSAIRIICLCAAAVLAVGGLYIKERSVSQKYRLQLENRYSSALYELDSRLNNIAMILEKTVYVSASKQMSAFASELYSEAELAKNALTQLPSGESSLDTLNRFLSQVGNYALSVSKSVITGNEITPEQQKNLELLGSTAKTVSEAISNSQVNYNNLDYWSDELENRLDETIGESTLADSLTELEENLTDYPTLIYDGPYSDHILTKMPLMTTSAPQINREAAKAKAKEILSGDYGELHYDGMQGGKIECYRFLNDNVTVTVSKNGGYMVFMRKNRDVSGNSFSYEQALIKAKKFLEDNSFKNMIDTYYFTEDGVCVINFAYLDGQTICYTDLIKVGVALDTGEIMLYEATGYLTNHTTRAFETPAYTSQQAAQTINSGLDIKESSIALIPSDGGAEIRCYEFLCRAENNDEMLIYVNVLNLEIEQIFILLKTDGGTLVK